MLLEVSDSRHRLPLAEKGAFSPGGFQGNLLAEKSVLSWPFLFLNGNLALLEYSLFFPGGGRTSLTLVVGFKFPPVSLPKGHPKATFGGVTSLWPFSPKEIPLGCVFCETPPPLFGGFNGKPKGTAILGGLSAKARPLSGVWARETGKPKPVRRQVIDKRVEEIKRLRLSSACLLFF